MANVSKAYTQVLLNWSAAALTRWSNALDAIQNEQYESKHLYSDIVGYWLDDVLGAWFGAIGIGVGARTVLIPIAVNTQTEKSDPFPVPNPDQAKITDLVMLGGDGTEKIPSDQAQTHLRLDKPTDSPGTVQIVLLSLDTLPTNLVPGQYLGVVYEGQQALARVIVLVS